MFQKSRNAVTASQLQGSYRVLMARACLRRWAHRTPQPQQNYTEPASLQWGHKLEMSEFLVTLELISTQHRSMKCCPSICSPPPCTPPSCCCHSPGTLCAALTLRLPLRVDSDANTHGVWGCGTVSMETTSWVVRTETFWKQDVALHMFSWKEVCTPSQRTLGWDDFLQYHLEIGGSSLFRIVSDGAEVSLLCSKLCTFLIFFKKWFIWSSLVKLKLAFKGFDTSKMMSAIKKKKGKKLTGLSN